jgi:hypothetical protein
VRAGLRLRELTLLSYHSCLYCTLVAARSQSKSMRGRPHRLARECDAHATALSRIDADVLDDMLDDLCDDLVCALLKSLNMHRDVDHNILEVALRAPLSRAFSLSPWASFEPLQTSPADVKVLSHGRFNGHRTFELPCDYRCTTMADGGLDKRGLMDTIHCFNLAAALALPLNKRLQQASLNAEAASKGTEGLSTPIHPSTRTC